MSTAVGLSRARFYELVSRGVFLPPVYSTATRRPFYTADMQQRNLAVRQQQQGIHGEYVLFYERRQQGGTTARARCRGRHTSPHSDLVGRLVPQLQNLGLSGATSDEVNRAVAACYSDGVGETDEGEVLRAVYRRLRRQNDA